MFGKFGPLEIALIFGVILLLIGPKKLPELAKSFGKSIKEFRKAGKESGEDEISDKVIDRAND